MGLTAKNNDESAQAKLVLSKALVNTAGTLNIGRKQLARILGISEASLSRVFDCSRTIDPESKEGELALLFIRMYRSLDTMLGGNEVQCQLWLNAYNYHLHGVPIQMLEQIEGLIHVVGYLDAMRGKV